MDIGIDPFADLVALGALGLAANEWWKRRRRERIHVRARPTVDADGSEAIELLVRNAELLPIYPAEFTFATSGWSGRWQLTEGEGGSQGIAPRRAWVHKVPIDQTRRIDDLWAEYQWTLSLEDGRLLSGGRTFRSMSRWRKRRLEKRLVQKGIDPRRARAAAQGMKRAR